MLKKLLNKLKLHLSCRLIIVAIFLCIVAILNIDTIAYGGKEYSGTGCIVKETTETSYHYEFDENMTSGCPEFVEEYYFTVLVDDAFIKFQVPYPVTEELQLGDSITVLRQRHRFLPNKYANYKAIVCGINVPAIIVDK